jgi:hypothetical protein
MLYLSAKKLQRIINRRVMQQLGMWQQQRMWQQLLMLQQLWMWN